MSWAQHRSCRGLHGSCRGHHMDSVVGLTSALCGLHRLCDGHHISPVMGQMWFQRPCRGHVVATTKIAPPHPPCRAHHITDVVPITQVMSLPNFQSRSKISPLRSHFTTFHSSKSLVVFISVVARRKSFHVLHFSLTHCIFLPPKCCRDGKSKKSPA